MIRALEQYDCLRQRLIHTGQHYDQMMSGVFFEELDLPKLDVCLEIGSGTHAVQTAEAMKRIEGEMIGNEPDILLVYGDVNSTMAGALVAAKLGVTVGHVEAGLRSFDRTMPEEINRLVTDQLSDVLFIPSEEAMANLEREGIDRNKIRFVGNVMIDTLIRLLPRAREDGRLASIRQENGIPQELAQNSYALVTLHRPANVDCDKNLRSLIDVLEKVGQDGTPVLFPVHPRTHKRLAEMNLQPNPELVFLMDPLGYIDFIALQANASFVITDSGGVQEETTYLGVPCLTMRPNTERPVTIDVGTNQLIADDYKKLDETITKIQNNLRPPVAIPELWDGNSGERIAKVLAEEILGSK